MQIRLTVLAPRSGQTPGRSCDVLVTAPAGTALSAVASGLASAVTGPEDSVGGGAIVLYAGHERLDAQRCALGDHDTAAFAVESIRRWWTARCSRCVRRVRTRVRTAPHPRGCM